MANRNFPSDRVMNFQHGGVWISGKFSIDATPGIEAGGTYGEGYTVAYTGLGLYTVTTRDPYRHVIAFGADLGLTTPVADYVCNCGIPGGGAGAVVTMTINCFDTATATAADPGNVADEISFWLLLSNNQNDAVR